jgi:hypothetical protein
MADDNLTNAAQRSQLSKLADDGQNNNYGEWETKAYHMLRSWDLLKYIEGPESTAPVIPPLRLEQVYDGFNDHDVLTRVHIRGNQDEYDEAVANAAPWMTGNNLCLSKIVNAVPNIQLHLVRRAQYAKEAWDSLKSFYQPGNTLRAATLKSDITGYRCQNNMNISTWLSDMQRLYDTLYGTAPDAMTDSAFALAIIDNMPQDDNAWRGFVSELRTKLRQYENTVPATPITSREFITLIRDEFWFRHRDDPQVNAHVFSARSQVDKRGTKRARDTNSSTPNPKRARNDKLCTNTHCGAQRGHDYSECIAFGGGSQGKYTEWWRGPWNIHLPKDKRDKSNNIPPETHPAYARLKTPAPKIFAMTYTHTASRANTDDDLSSSDEAPTISLAITNETPVYVWNTLLGNELIIASLPILEHELQHSDDCYHDSAANRHVFHDKSAFETYTSIEPLSVKGFGRNLSTVAIGRGTVRLRCENGTRESSVLLTDVLHIPAARSNLISGVRLDNAGVTTTLGNGGILLTHEGCPFVAGKIRHGMYRLNVEIVRPTRRVNNHMTYLRNLSYVAAANLHDPDFYIA